MRVAVAGSKNWNNYNELMRQLTLMIEDHAHENPTDSNIIFVHYGSSDAENMVTEYCGKVYSYLRQKGYTVKDQIFKPNKSLPGLNRDNELLESNIDKAIVFINSPNKRINTFIRLADAHDIPTTVVKG